MKILITGVAGLIGSRLATWILDNTDYDIVGVDDLSGGYLENIDERVDFHNIDLLVDGADNLNPIPPERLGIFPKTEGVSSSALRGFEYG